MTVQFSAADLDLFAAASHDRNPLHLSATYARRTQFGQQVVYGVLGALAVIARIPDRPGERVGSIALEFPRPAFPDVAYRVSDSGFALMDGSSTLAKVNVGFVPGERWSSEIGGEFSAGRQRESAATPTDSELVAGLALSGSYRPDPAACAALWNRLGVDPTQWGSLPLASLLWSSYLAGMELPGERALYSRLAIRFEATAGLNEMGAVTWNARIHSRNALNLLRIEFQLSVGGRLAATGELGVLLRPPSVTGSKESFAVSDELAGRVALVTGASRGLGAAITRALALRGAHVLASFQQSRAEAEALRDELPAGRVELLQGDAGDPGWCRRIQTQYPEIDFLILNACPTVLPMRVEADTIDRVNAYAARAFALVSVPLATLLENVRSRVVLISSAYVESTPKEFPHYVAAKAAAEALVHAVARQQKNRAFLIVRPPKLMTDMTNTAYGSGDALAPEVVASQLVERLCREGEPGLVEVFTGGLSA